MNPVYIVADTDAQVDEILRVLDSLGIAEPMRERTKQIYIDVHGDSTYSKLFSEKTIGSNLVTYIRWSDIYPPF